MKGDSKTMLFANLGRHRTLAVSSACSGRNGAGLELPRVKGGPPLCGAEGHLERGVAAPAQEGARVGAGTRAAVLEAPLGLARTVVRERGAPGLGSCCSLSRRWTVSYGFPRRTAPSVLAGVLGAGLQ